MFVFSDEAGHWSDKRCKTYIRSFIVFDKREYSKKEEIFIDNYSDRNIKWKKSKLKEDKDFLRLIFNNSKIFIALTDLDQFRRNRYKIREVIKEIDYNTILFGFEDKDKINLRRSLMARVDQLIFLYIYEKQFIIRFINSINEHLKQCKGEVQLKIGNPQQNNKDFLTMLKSIPETEDWNVELKKGEKKCLGIGAADFIASSFKEMLEGETRNNAKQFYRKWVEPNSLTGDRENPNPSYQFWEKGKEEYKGMLRDIRREVDFELIEV